ncbi:MAG: metalloregulator ArsR/SmtB family transcription factor [Dehalococcoidia bacterium]
MVDEESRLDEVFRALADPTRRALVRRLAEGDALVLELAQPFEMSKQAVSKHLQVLESAGLVTKAVEGRSTRVQLRPQAMRDISNWLDFYRSFWTDSMDRLVELVDGPTRNADTEVPR